MEKYVCAEPVGLRAYAVQLYAIQQPDCDYQPRPGTDKHYPFMSIRVVPAAHTVQEVKLVDNAAERDLHESLAEIYSIIITLDALEKAYMRDSIRESEYTETCDRLLRQYKRNLADDTVASAFGDLESFKLEWDVRRYDQRRGKGERKRWC